jgi:hypothetical protein
MNEEVPSTTTTPTAPPSHVEMFFRYVAGLAQIGGVQAFTMAIAVPKPDGTSAVLSTAGGMEGATDAWKDEIANLLADNAAKSARTLSAPPKKEESGEAEAPAETV